MTMTISPFIFGTETELAVFVESARGSIRPAPVELASAIIEDVANRYKHASSPPPERRLFLTNGGCVYADIGGHPEVASAECADPTELLAQNIALRRMLAESAEAVGRVYGITIRIVANNVDYGFGGARTYGHHVNILTHGLSHAQAATQLAPLLAAMPIIAGAGKVSLASESAGFELSQRAQYMAALTGKHTTTSRAMVTVKDEALSNRGIRLHLICFDTVKNAFQLALVPAIVALTLKAVEASKDRDIAGPAALADPIQALHKVNCDPSLSSRLPLKHRGTTTALEIHEYYIQIINKLIDQTKAPDWVGQMLKIWQEMIRNLSEDPFWEIKRLDWVTKLVLFTKLLERIKLTWQEYSRWIYVLASVRRLKATWPGLDPLRLTLTDRGRAGIRRSALGVLDQYLVRHSLSWKDFPMVWNAANQLCQACLRYHTLTADVNEPSEHSLEAKPLMTKRMIERARTLPPPGTRAAIRGRLIRDAPAGTITAGWTFIRHSDGRQLVMNDPLGKDATWIEQKHSLKKEKS